MRNLKLVLEYDGTGFAGWQIQPGKRTIQGVLNEAVASIEGVQEVKITGSGRTDAGVHALGQVANFLSRRRISCANYRKALNSLLPKDVVVKKVVEVPLEFNARRDAKRKKYRYVILNREYPSALERNRVYFLPKSLDLKAIKDAMGFFMGEKDFSSFCSSGSEVKNKVRKIFNFEMNVENGHIIFEITGNGFLRQMVRNIIGTLVFVGLRKLSPSDVPHIFEKGDRRAAGPAVPAKGLYLVEVVY